MTILSSCAPSFNRMRRWLLASSLFAIYLVSGQCLAQAAPSPCTVAEQTASRLSVQECEALRLAQQTPWPTVHADDAVVIRVERATFERRGAEVEATVLIDTRVEAGKSAKDLPSFERRVRLNCNGRESAVLSERTYAGRGGRGALRSESKTPGAALKPVLPGALDATLLVALCR